MKARWILLFLMTLLASASSFAAEKAVEGPGGATQSAQTEASSGESDCGS